MQTPRGAILSGRRLLRSAPAGSVGDPAVRRRNEHSDARVPIHRLPVHGVSAIRFRRQIRRRRRSDEIAFKACKGHFCPSESAAVLYHVKKRTLFRLDYDEKRGMRLSKELSQPENSALRDWLVSWWKVWPGR